MYCFDFLSSLAIKVHATLSMAQIKSKFWGQGHSHLPQDKGLLLFSLKQSCYFYTDGTINNFVMQEAILERSSQLSQVTWLVEADWTLDADKAAVENHTGSAACGLEWVDTKKKENQGGFGLGNRHLSIPGLQISNGKDPQGGAWGCCIGSWVEGHSAFLLNPQVGSPGMRPPFCLCFPFPECAIRNPTLSLISAECQEENNLISWLKWFLLSCHHLTVLGAHSLK